MKINDRVDLGNEIDSLIVAHCNSHQCCMEDNKSEIVNDILDLKSPPFDWIRIKDKIPLAGQIVLWWNADIRMVEFGSSGSFNGENVTHWMPLPQRPKSFKIRQ